MKRKGIALTPLLVVILISSLFSAALAVVAYDQIYRMQEIKKQVLNGKEKLGVNSENSK